MPRSMLWEGKTSIVNANCLGIVGTQLTAPPFMGSSPQVRAEHTEMMTWLGCLKCVLGERAMVGRSWGSWMWVGRVQGPGFLNNDTEVIIESWSHPLKAFKSQAESNLMRFHLEWADGLDGFSRPLLALRFYDRMIFKIAILYFVLPVLSFVKSESATDCLPFIASQWGLFIE